MNELQDRDPKNTNANNQNNNDDEDDVDPGWWYKFTISILLIVMSIVGIAVTGHYINKGKRKYKINDIFLTNISGKSS